MKIKRLTAYLIDMLIVTIIVYCLTSISFLNPQMKKYQKYYTSYQQLSINYSNFITDLSKYYEDNKLTNEEYNKLIERNPDYKKQVNNYYKDEKLTKSNYTKLKNSTQADYQKKYKAAYYKFNQNLIYYNIIQIIVILSYFIGFNMITNGQTLGKKLLRLKISNNKDASKKVTFLNYLIRALILYNPICYLALTVGVVFLDANNYYNWALICSNFKNYLELIIITMMIIRIDNRGLHELLSNTKVILLDKFGNEIPSIKKSKITIIEDNSIKKSQGKNKKDMIIDEKKESDSN